MQDYNSYDLFVKNPRIHTNFPFLALDCNNKKTIPPRMRFQEMHWHEDVSSMLFDGLVYRGVVYLLKERIERNEKI